MRDYTISNARYSNYKRVVEESSRLRVATKVCEQRT